MCAQSLIDSLSGVAYITAGVYRITIVSIGYKYEMVCTTPTTNLHPSQVTPWECTYNAPSTVLFYYFDPLSGMMLMCISIDRLLAVVWPMKYYVVNYFLEFYIWNECHTQSM
jgi:hypothetical protein